ncbi:MAG: acetate kinase [Ruminococcaceae bacterium]|nr:acetate kinase [Oscillospiraceae bacterium]
MKILVINAGSSSLKFQLIDMDNEQVIAKGICEEIGGKSGFKFKVPGREDYKLAVAMPTHAEALQLVLDTLVDEKLGVIKSVAEIGAVGHRVLHGGDKLSGSVLVTEEAKAIIEECCDLGPLHNPANLKGIVECEKIMDVPQVAVFDTSFHQTMPDFAYMYALPYEYYEKYKIRRYGFHGTSHRYVSERAIAMLGKPAAECNVVTCHLGNGASFAAVKGGKCFDTSMGVTPLEGIMMGTRSGNIDPAIIPYLMRKGELTTADDIDKMMNKKSGMLGVSGKTSDNQEIGKLAEAGDERAILCEKMYSHQIAKNVGSYIACMGGADAIVFTGGIGENAGKYRADLCEKLGYMGVKLDPEKNKIRGEEVEISTPDSTVKVFVIPTNEELVIARDTLEIVKALNA